VAEVLLDGRTQGTTYRVRARAADAVAIGRSIEALLGRIDRLLSSWRDDSEIERFNAAPAHVPFALSSETAELLGRAREIGRHTDGAFDPAIGALIRLWGFGGAQPRADLPTPAEVAAALRRSGMRHLKQRGLRVSKDAAALRVDLNGIAQGYSVDRVFALLHAAGYTQALVEIGGEVRVGDPTPGTQAWRIALESPDPLRPLALHTLALRQAAVSTSGSYRSGFEVEGVRYPHILDPRDGRPIHNGMLLASVIAADTATADALSTALMVLGPQRALAAVARLPGVECLLLQQRDGALREFRSPGFARWIAPR
jgi:thiamine biosynthesis lipoprotein